MTRRNVCFILAAAVAGSSCGGAPPEGGDDLLESQQAVIISTAWTPWFSEENGGAICPDGMVMGGLDTYGSYSDNLRMYCVTPSTGLGLVPGSHHWTGFISEETPNNYAACAADEAIVGLACDNRYCDNMALMCARLAGGVRMDQTEGIMWWYSDGWPTMQDNYHYANNLKCDSRYCDNMLFKFYYYH
jgi:hypothetical protein